MTLSDGRSFIPAGRAPLWALHWLVVAVLSLVPIAAFATPVTWQLQDFEFSDGGIATGFFRYDADTDSVLAVDITTSRNETLGLGGDYGTPTPLFGDTLVDLVTGFPLLGEGRFLFQLAAPMSNAGGSISLTFAAGLASEGVCSDSGCTSLNPFRTLVSGSITAIPPIPLPAMLPAFVAALGGLTMLGRFRRRAR